MLNKSETLTLFHNGIGNFVCFTPALQALASMDKSRKIDILFDPKWYDYRKKEILSLIELLPFVGRVLINEEINQLQYKTWFWTGWSYWNGELLSIFKQKNSHVFPDWDQSKEHESDYYLRIARLFYGYMGPKPKQVILTSNQPLLDNRNKKTIVFCNGGFDDLKFFKNWSKFSLLSKTLKSCYPESLIIKIGFGKELEDTLTDIDYVGKLTLAETAKVISQADLMISTDTGNMHIADALNVPLIVLWGGSSLAKNRPYETKSKIIYLGLECQKVGTHGHCKYQQCKNAICLNNISVEQVMLYIKHFFCHGNFNI